MDDLSRFEVYLHSKPSPGRTFYQGKVSVFAEDSDDAKNRAVHDLAKGNFRDYGLDAWVIEKVISR